MKPILQAAIMAFLWPMATLAQTQAENPKLSSIQNATSNTQKTTHQFSAGLSIGTLPRYMGSDENKTLALPYAAWSYGNFFADTVRGLGVQYRHASGFQASVSLNHDRGRKDRDSRLYPGSQRLAGMGQIKGGAMLQASVTQALTSWLSASAEARLRPSDDGPRGHDLRLGLNARVYENATHTIRISGDIHAGNRDFNQAHFGVSQTQAQRSRFQAYDMNAGVYAYALGVQWIYRPAHQWSVISSIRSTQLTGNAAKSPLVERKTGINAGVTLKYDF